MGSNDPFLNNEMTAILVLESKVSYVKNLLLVSFNCMDAGHVSEYALY